MKEEVKVIGICGGSGSGKTTVVKKISEMVHKFALIPQDSYYKDIDPALLEGDRHLKFNFDHPDQFDNDRLYEDLVNLKLCKDIEIPVYDFVASRRLTETVHIKSASVVILEGILIFADERIRSLIDVKLYIETPSDIRFIRRLKRDIVERGRTIDSVIDQYLAAVRPGHFQFVEPMKEFADLIVPEGGYNETAMEVLGSFVNNFLKKY